MYGRRFEIFRLFGFPIRIDISWLLILLLVTYSLAAGFFPANHPGLPKTAYWAMGFVAAIGLFASILFHELSHSIVARHFKIKIDGITLFIFGGVAEMREESPSPKVEFWVAVMGPVASTVLAILFFRLSAFAQSAEVNRGIILILYYLGFMNGMLALFNLVPAFPLDGGRIFRSILWAIKKDFLIATRISAVLGQGFGWILIGFGVVSFFRRSPMSGMWYILIGFFLKSASQMSLKQVVIQNELQSIAVEQIMDPDFIQFHQHDRMADVFPKLERGSLHTHYPVLDSDQLIGVLPLLKLRNLKEDRWELKEVGDLAINDIVPYSIGKGEDTWNAFKKMRENQLSSLFVMEGGKMVGLLTIERLLQLFNRQGKK